MMPSPANERIAHSLPCGYHRGLRERSTWNSKQIEQNFIIQWNFSRLFFMINIKCQNVPSSMTLRKPVFKEGWLLRRSAAECGCLTGESCSPVTDPSCWKAMPSCSTKGKLQRNLSICFRSPFVARFLSGLLRSQEKLQTQAHLSV